jgi:hypothetical protein
MLFFILQMKKLASRASLVFDELRQARASLDMRNRKIRELRSTYSGLQVSVF